jgi:hypothetical protein
MHRVQSQYHQYPVVMLVVVVTTVVLRSAHFLRWCEQALLLNTQAAAGQYRCGAGVGVGVGSGGGVCAGVLHSDHECATC